MSQSEEEFDESEFVSNGNVLYAGAAGAVLFAFYFALLGYGLLTFL